MTGADRMNTPPPVDPFTGLFGSEAGTKKGGGQKSKKGHGGKDGMGKKGSMWTGRTGGELNRS